MKKLKPQGKSVPDLHSCPQASWEGGLSVQSPRNRTPPPGLLTAWWLDLRVWAWAAPSSSVRGQRKVALSLCLSFSSCKMGITSVPTSWSYLEEQMASALEYVLNTCPWWDCPISRISAGHGKNKLEGMTETLSLSNQYSFYIYYRVSHPVGRGLSKRLGEGA